MTQHTSVESEIKEEKRRRRRRPFPSMEFEHALLLPRAVLEHGVDGEIRRLTLFGKLERSPDSSSSRTLVTNLSKYGLTTGSYAATSLTVTDEARIALSVEKSPREAIETQFQLAIGQFGPFRDLYQKLQDQRIPANEVLKDELGSMGVDDSDRSKAADIFTANLRFLDLTHSVSGAEYVRSVEQVVEEKLKEPISGTEGSGDPHATDFPDPPATPEGDEKDPLRASLPELHVDIQIHIDSAASPEQIDQIFASMARHLYGRETN